MFRSPVDVPGVVGVAAGSHRCTDVGHHPLMKLHSLVEPVPEGLLVLLGNAQEHPDGAHGIGAPRSAMKSKPPWSTRGSRLRAAKARISGAIAAMRRGVNTRLRTPRCRLWSGGSSKMNMPGGISHPGLDDLEHRSLGGAVGLPFEQAALDVVEAAEGIELVLLVEVQRRFLAQALPRQIGISVDLEVVGVVVNVFWTFE